jgi:hypothetical protein
MIRRYRLMTRAIPFLLIALIATGCSDSEKTADSNIYELSRNGVLFSWSSPMQSNYEGCSAFFFKVTNRGASDLESIAVNLLPSGPSFSMLKIGVGQSKIKSFDCVTNVSPEGSTLSVFYNSKDNLVGEVFEEFIDTRGPSESSE